MSWDTFQPLGSTEARSSLSLLKSPNLTFQRSWKSSVRNSKPGSRRLGVSVCFVLWSFFGWVLFGFFFVVFVKVFGFFPLIEVLQQGKASLASLCCAGPGLDHLFLSLSLTQELVPEW